MFPLAHGLTLILHSVSSCVSPSCLKTCIISFNRRVLIHSNTNHRSSYISAQPDICSPSQYFICCHSISTTYIFFCIFNTVVSMWQCVSEFVTDKLGSCTVYSHMTNTLNRHDPGSALALLFSKITVRFTVYCPINVTNRQSEIWLTGDWKSTWDS